MKDTRFHDDYSEVVPRYATGYRQAGRGEYRVVKSLYAQVGAGGLLTTIEDLGKWMRVYEDSGALPGSPRLGERLLERGVFAMCNWSEAPIEALRNNLLLEVLH